MTDTEVYKEDPGQLYSKRFFSKMQKLRKWQPPIAKSIGEVYNLKSVVDFGCASGYYLDGYKESGAEVKGYEYLLENSLEYISEDIKPFVSQGNVMEDIDCGQHDLVMSIEVAEHLLPEKSDVFVDNLVRASKKYILLTAAPPGQGGTGHINEQPREYWIEKLEERGFKYSEKDVVKIQSLFKNLPRSRYMKLIKRQIMFFVKEYNETDNLTGLI